MRKVLSWIAIGVMSFTAFEGSVRLLYRLRGKPPPHVDQSTRNEWRWALGHLTDEGRPAPSEGMAYDSGLGFVQCPTPGRETEVNAAGMRARRDFGEERIPGVPRIVLVGDSLTMGATVDYDHAFHAVLEREFLPGWEVLNLGTSAYGADQALLMWEARGARYRPDVVVFGFYHRDFFRNRLRFKGYLKPYFTLDEAGELQLHSDHLMPPEQLVAEYESGRRRVGGWHYSQALAALHRVWSQWPRIGQQHPDWKLMAAILKRFRDGAVARGARPFLLVIPERREKVQGSVFETIDRLAIEEARTLGMPALSLMSHFHAENDEEREHPLFREDGHLTEAGNCEMARLLALALAEAGLAPEAGARASEWRCSP